MVLCTVLLWVTNWVTLIYRVCFIANFTCTESENVNICPSEASASASVQQILLQWRGRSGGQKLEAVPQWPRRGRQCPATDARARPNGERAEHAHHKHSLPVNHFGWHAIWYYILLYRLLSIPVHLQAVERFSQLRSRRDTPLTHVTQDDVADLTLIGDFSKVGSAKPILYIKVMDEWGQ